jgi:hypothetical protein
LYGFAGVGIIVLVCIVLLGAILSLIALLFLLPWLIASAIFWLFIANATRQALRHEML